MLVENSTIAPPARTRRAACCATTMVPRNIERLGGVVKSGGENVVLAKVSTALAELLKDEVEHVHAVAVPDPYGVDHVVALVRSASEDWTVEDLRGPMQDGASGVRGAPGLPPVDEDWPVSAEGELNTKRLRQFAVDRIGVVE